MPALCENFLIGYFNSRYNYITSDALLKVLGQESLEYLRRLGGNVQGETVAVTPLCRDKLLAISFLKPTRDEMGRPGVWNHTILLPCSNVYSSLDLPTLLADKFIRQTDGTLKPPLPPISVSLPGDKK